MDNTITAQEIKVKGMAILKEKTRKNQEAFITVRGEKSFVVLTIEQYKYFRECELEAALGQAQKDLSLKKYKTVNVKDHLKDLKNV